LSSRSPFPGINALWPCLGTALLLLSGGGSAVPGIANRLLGQRPFVAVGLLSYSIYLWHWPLIAFLNYRGVELIAWTRWLAIVAPIVASAISYVLVEHPFRYRFRMRLRTAFCALVVAPVALGFGSFALADAGAGSAQSFEAASVEDDGAESTESPGQCAYNRDLSVFADCVVGTKSAEIDGVLVGDSYAGMYTHFMDVLAKDAGFSLRYRWFRLSPPIPGTSAGKKPDSEQAAYTRQRHELVAKYEFGVLISSWSNYQYADTEENRLWDEQGQDVSRRANDLQLAAVDDLVKRGVTLILLDRPRAPPGRKLLKKIRNAKSRGESLAEFRVPFTKRPDDYVFDSIRAKYPGILVIRPDDVICGESDCGVAIGQTVLYRSDGSHLEHEGARLLGTEYLATRPNPLKTLKRKRDSTAAR
jgi:hypothetical protein